MCTSNFGFKLSQSSKSFQHFTSTGKMVHFGFVHWTHLRMRTMYQGHFHSESEVCRLNQFISMHSWPYSIPHVIFLSDCTSTMSTFVFLLWGAVQVTEVKPCGLDHRSKDVRFVHFHEEARTKIARLDCAVSIYLYSSFEHLAKLYSNRK